MNWPLCALLCVLLVELVLRLPFGPAISAVVGVSGKSMRLLRTSAISDHWKEKAMGAYARATFIGTMKLAGLLAVLIGAALLVTYLFDLIAPGFAGFIVSWAGLGASLVLATLYAILRKKVF